MAENTHVERRKGWLKTRSKSSVAVNMAHNYYDPRWGNQTIMLDTLAPDGGTVASIIPIPGEWDLVISKPPSDVEWKLIFPSGSTSLTRVLRDGKEMALCGYCRDCRHWETRHGLWVGGRWPQPESHICLLARTRPGGEAHPEWQQALLPPDTGQFIRGGADLLTPADFACNRYQAKE